MWKGQELPVAGCVALGVGSRPQQVRQQSRSLGRPAGRGKAVCSSGEVTALRAKT